MVAIGWASWCAVTNSNPWPGSYWSPVQTRPRLLTGSRVLRGAGGPLGGADAVRRVPPSSARRCARQRQVPLASPSSGSPAPRARTGGPVLPAFALYGPARRSPRRTVSPGGLHRHYAHGDEPSGRPLLQPTRGGRAVDQGGQDCHPLDAPLLSSLPGQRGAIASRRPRLQPRQSAAPAGAARRHSELVVDEPATAAVQDRRTADPACAVLRAPAGRKLLDGKSLSADSRAHRATRMASDLIKSTVTRRARDEK